MPCPFRSMLDEAGYYTVEGMAVMMAQARSLGFSITIGTQDIPSLKRIVEKEANSMIANATTFLWMRVAETEETGGLAVKQVGEATFAQAAGYAAKSGEFTTPYLDNMEARFEKQSRITVRALRALEPGDAYVTFRDTVLKMKTFYANPEGEYGDGLDNFNLRVNHFLAFDKPTQENIRSEAVGVEIAERLVDLKFAQIVESRAQEARALVAKAATEKRDPTTLRDEISAGSVAFLRTAYGTPEANKEAIKKASATDLITAGAVSIAAILQAMQKQGDTFAADVRKVEGLGVGGREVSEGVRSGRGRSPSQVPGLVDPTQAASDRVSPSTAVTRARRSPKRSSPGAAPARRSHASP